MERQKRYKGSVWEFCYANKFFGMFGFEIRACGQKLVKVCAHTHAAKLVVRIAEVLSQNRCIFESKIHLFWLSTSALMDICLVCVPQDVDVVNVWWKQAKRGECPAFFSVHVDSYENHIRYPSSSQQSGWFCFYCKVYIIINRFVLCSYHNGQLWWLQINMCTRVVLYAHCIIARHLLIKYLTYRQLLMKYYAFQ